MLKIIRICVLLYAMACGAQERGSNDGPYTICGTIFGYRPGATLYLALFDSQEHFKEKIQTKTIRIVKEELPPDSVCYCFHGVKAGDYLIAVYQDLNNDKKMNTGMFGCPEEPYRTYKSCNLMFGPNFSKCKFTVSGDVSGADLFFN